ncbi:MAG: hypothetical protein AAFQ42_08275 [Pseudomonadota bacterium]
MSIKPDPSTLRPACAEIDAFLRTGPDAWSAPTPAVLVGYGFRSWMRGAAYGTIGDWERCWNVYARALGPARARGTVSELACWVRALRASGGRAPRVMGDDAAAFSTDEQLAISIVAAGQNDVCPAMRACTYALIESSSIDASVDAGMAFAHKLQKDGVLLPSAAVVNAIDVSSISGMSAGSRH